MGNTTLSKALSSILQDEERSATPLETTITTIATQEKTIHVAAYCRVSTDLAEQEESLEAQELHFRSMAALHPIWHFVGIYSDQGESGTNNDRPGLQSLLTACRAGKINLVLTKSISRFARNTVECLEMVRELVGLGVHLRFEKEGIDTSNMGSEFLLALLAGFAQMESRSISGNMKWSIEKRFQAGTYKYSRAPVGYRQTDDGLVIDHRGAVTIRQIYALYLSGAGTPTIAKELNKTHACGRVWTPATVNIILRNPVYIGDILHQKTWTDEEFKVHKNTGEVAQYYVTGHHEGIISKDQFTAVQELMESRKHASSRTAPVLSGLLVCAGCNARLRRIKGDRWRCPGCDQPPVREDNILNAYATALHKIRFADLLAVYTLLLPGIPPLPEKADNTDQAATAAALKAALRTWDGSITTSIVRDHLSQVIVFEKRRFRFDFRCGLSVTEQPDTVKEVR